MKEGGEYYSEGEYIPVAKKAIEVEFNHLLERLGLNKEEEKK